MSLGAMDDSVNPTSSSLSITDIEHKITEFVERHPRGEQVHMVLHVDPGTLSDIIKIFTSGEDEEGPWSLVRCWTLSFTKMSDN